MIQKKWILIVLVLVVLGVSVLTYFMLKAPASAYTHRLEIGNTSIKVAYADTPALQEQGLSGTTELKDGTGMLFVFPSDAQVAFWMKDMRYPIDIIWIGSDMKVKDITPSLDPSTYPNSYGPKEPVRYVLEVPAGFSTKNKIAEGTEVSF